MLRPSFLTFAFAASFLLCAPGARAQQDGETPPSVAAFEFHSGFWVNLHHFLYLQGRLRNVRSSAGTLDQTPRPEFGSPASTDGLSPDQQKAWNVAVSTYAKDWSSRDLMSNSEMTLINNRLAELENCADLAGKPGTACAAGLKPDLVAALVAAAPIYRARWWPEQDRENRAWINSVVPLVRRLGTEMSGQLVDAYQRRWPAGPLRVDVIWYAGPMGSYTSLDPVHVNIGSHDARNQGLAAFELLYREASQTLALSVGQKISAECRRRGLPIPRDLWYAVVFYTASQLVRRTLSNVPDGRAGADSLPGSTSSRNGLYDRGWGNYQQLLENYWQPYLDDQIDFDTAIARMVSAL